MTSSEEEAARAAIAALRGSWTDAVAHGNADALASLVTDDYEVWANAAPTLAGPASVVAAMRAALARMRVVQRFEPIELVVSGNWAFERGVESLTVTPIGGGDTRTMSQRATLILHRGDDGKWRYARGMTNALPPDAAPPP
jgi:uncharacterized protein (TIGR02246 family)